MNTPSTPVGGKAGQPAQPVGGQQSQAAPTSDATPAPAPQAAASASKPQAAAPQAAPAAAQATPTASPQPPAGAQRPFQGQQGLGARPPAAGQEKPPEPQQAPQKDPLPKDPPKDPLPQGPGPQDPGPQDAQPDQAAPPPRPADSAKPPALRPQGQPIPVRPLSPPAIKPAAKPTAKAVAKPAAKAGGKALARPRVVPAQPLRPPAAIAEPKPRHWLILGSFLVLVMLPSLIWAGYLWLRASDQYVSSVGFSVRQEQSTPSIDLLGGLSPLTGGGGASDTDILYEYIRSQDMVEKIDDRLDLRTRFSRDWPHDFVFAFNPEAHIEDLTDYWQRQVKVLYDSTTQLITLKVSAFTPQDAQAIAAAVFQESSDKINELSTIAQGDATRLAKGELDKARTELTETRQAMTAFRMRSQIVDPQADLAGQMGVLSGLQAQLAEVLVAHDLLLDNAQPTDHRVTQSQQKIDALRRLIDAERSKFGAEGQGPAGESYAQLMAEYEKLAVDREFAEGAYRSARIAYETALADAQRQARYLAAHIEPKVAQSATQPNWAWLWAMITGMLLAGWSIMVLIYYSVRDRR